MFQPRCFVAIKLSGPVLDGLAKLQRRLQDAAPEGAKVEPIPRRYLHVTLDDLGPCPPASDEAVALTLERLLPKHGPFNLQFGGLEAFPNPDQPRLVYARLEDPKGRLGALRQALHEPLVRYGFAVDPRPFHPHVALARVNGLGGLSAVSGRASTRDLGNLRVKHIALYRQAPAEQRGPRYRVAWTRTLVRFPNSQQTAPGPAHTTEEITRQLDERLAHHATLTAGRARVRRRRTDIEEEE